MQFILTVVIFVIMLTNPIDAYACKEKTNDTSLRFDIEDDTIVDIDSGLTWMRCGIGQTWDGQTCAGEVTLLTWHEANEKLKEMTVQNESNDGWRLPRVNELATIIDISCKDPRIDLTIFPNTPATYYWTNSRVPKGYGEAYVLSFGSERVSSKALDSRYAVRLVRGRSSTLN
ncbi:MAG: DUF1566 domain-containing protein [Gammaproteobacteria bacterium]|nr:DUF1566 domain-containing protein [Gammaproteobacteria bacterium]